MGTSGVSYWNASLLSRSSASLCAVSVQSPAKINWTLCVVARRADGYHEIESLVSPVSLYDELHFALREEPGVELVCNAPGVPIDESNLIIRAASRLVEAAAVKQGVKCRLTKRIPVGGGLGGGSSNAAATLAALSHLWGLDWPRDRLCELAADLGSDVPLFLHGGPVVMRGRGERIEPARLGWRGWVVLVFPRVPVSTAAVYKAWRPGAQSDVDLCRFERGTASAVEWMEWTFNMLEEPAMEVCPLLKELAASLSPRAGRPVRVSGSGSTLFTAFDAAGEAAAFASEIERELGLETYVARPIGQDAGLA